MPPSDTTVELKSWRQTGSASNRLRQLVSDSPPPSWYESLDLSDVLIM